MAKTCFCGCGVTVPKFPLGLRSMNTRGRQISERLAYGAACLGDSDEFEEWFDDGRAILIDLRAAVHGEVNPRDLDEAAVRHWQAYGRNIEAGAITFGHPPIRDWVTANPKAVAAEARG